MGDLFKPTQTTTTSTSTPWGPQGDALKSAFGDAADVYASQKGTPFYQGDLYANMDPMTSQGITANANYATGQGSQAAGNVLTSGQGLLGAGSQGLRAYQSLYGASTADPTQGNIASAGAYADNPYISGQIDAASRDVTRNLNENQLPGLNEGASGSGNMNSSRAGVAEGIMRRGAADQIGDISSNMRGQAYQQGLGLAENARTANMSAMGQAGQGLGGVYAQGLGASAQGQDMTYANNNALITGGQLNQQDAQGQDNADFQRWQGNDTRQNDLLNRYYSIIGGQNWGGTQTGTQPGASPFQSLLGAASSAAGAYMAFSDPILKENIERTGDVTPKHGLPLYKFDYRQDVPGLDLPRERQLGVMATDVAKVLPAAVSLDQGYLKVDYGMLA